MPLVSDGFDLIVKLADTGGKTFPMPYQLVAADYAAATAAATTIIGRLNALTDMVVSGYSLSERFIEDALAFPTAPPVEGENKARLVLQIYDQPTKKVTVHIPGAIGLLYQAISGPGWDSVDLSYPPLAAYLTTWHPGGLATISDGENVALTPNNGLLSGKRIHTKSNFG